MIFACEVVNNSLRSLLTKSLFSSTVLPLTVKKPIPEGSVVGLLPSGLNFTIAVPNSFVNAEPSIIPAPSVLKSTAVPSLTGFPNLSPTLATTSYSKLLLLPEIIPKPSILLLAVPIKND